MDDHVKTTLDVAAAGLTGAALIGWLPAAAAVLTIIWTAIRIWETRTVQSLVSRWRHGSETRKAGK